MITKYAQNKHFPLNIIVVIQVNNDVMAQNYDIIVAKMMTSFQQGKMTLSWRFKYKNTKADLNGEYYRQNM